jgi:hypothetical protein
MSRRGGFEVGPLLAIGGVLLLLVSLFLDWFEPKLDEPDINAWKIFEVLDLLLAGSALVALVAALARLGLRLPQSVRKPGALLPAAGLALVIVLSQVLNHPPAAVGRDTAIGLWLALVGAGLMLVGAGLSVARVSLAVNVDRREPPTRPMPPASE